MGKHYLVIFVISLTLTLSACGYKDIDKRFFVVSIGVDEPKSEENKYRVLLKIAIPSADIKAGDQAFIIIDQESDSISGAVRMAKSQVDKELDFSHAKVILLGESVAKENVKDVMDWFLRRRDIQKISWVGIGKPSVKEVLQLKPKSERLPSNALFLSFGNSGTESAYIISEYLFDFWKRLRERGLDPLLPIIEVNKKDDDVFTINKAALFNKEKMVLTLSPEETKILNILLNHTNKVELSAKREDEEQFHIAIDEAKTDFDITNQDIVRVNVRMEGLIEEVLFDGNKAHLEKSKDLAEEKFKEDVLNLLKKMQKEQLDPLGLGLLYRANHASDDEWERWQEIYPSVEYVVDVEVVVKGTGLLK
ncbi:Ger(x)C family spore germination protein [Bacillus pinisoli]|uniref:Ger(x)C family spore germination protein n=1 Tax=Bacillus pinisoli TaxID=2901866 RepID=UPI001FF1369B|nr:Ger(x)C family spore germination protein [Bacillus pinisoli]